MALAAVAPATAAVFRCAYALPLLVLLARRERSDRPARERWLAATAGVLLAIDLIVWHQAIADVGAGLATVLGNLQVVFVGAIAWAVLAERPERRLLAVTPVVVAGIVLISGVLEAAFGANPARGVVLGVLTGLFYSGFILVLRQATTDPARPAGPLLDATAAAAVASALLGLAAGDVDLLPSWPAHGWLLLLAMSSQVLGWMLISTSLPRLPAALSSVLLTIQPVGSVVLGVVLLDEAPTALQVAGVALVLSGLLALALARSRAGVRARRAAAA